MQSWKYISISLQGGFDLVRINSTPAYERYNWQDLLLNEQVNLIVFCSECMRAIHFKLRAFVHNNDGKLTPFLNLCRYIFLICSDGHHAFFLNIYSLFFSQFIGQWHKQLFTESVSAYYNAFKDKNTLQSINSNTSYIFTLRFILMCFLVTGKSGTKVLEKWLIKTYYVGIINYLGQHVIGWNI